VATRLLTAALTLAFAACADSAPPASGSETGTGDGDPADTTESSEEGDGDGDDLDPIPCVPYPVEPDGCYTIDQPVEHPEPMPGVDGGLSHPSLLIDAQGNAQVFARRRYYSSGEFLGDQLVHVSDETGAWLQTPLQNSVSSNWSIAIGPDGALTFMSIDSRVLHRAGGQWSWGSMPMWVDTMTADPVTGQLFFHSWFYSGSDTILETKIGTPECIERRYHAIDCGTWMLDSYVAEPGEYTALTRYPWGNGLGYTRVGPELDDVSGPFYFGTLGGADFLNTDWSLVIDAAGVLHACGGDIYVRGHDQDDMTMLVLNEPSGYPIRDCSLAVRPDGNAYVALSSWEWVNDEKVGSGITYVARIEGDQVEYEIGDTDAVFHEIFPNTIALDPQGEPRMMIAGSEVLRYAKRSNGMWTTTIVPMFF
jgi:hypothetical protein